MVVDIFRIFDSLNWVKAMEPSIKYVRERTGGIAEAAISYTGDILDVSQTKYNYKILHAISQRFRKCRSAYDCD
jgi:pyruvate carboxylase